MRQNGGGDFTRGREYIIPGIKERADINRRGHLFVVTGRWTYSAGMTNATDFRKETNAILVGEPTGGRPNGYQENREFRLPNSHLSVWVSTRFYEFQKTDTPGVMPDQRIDPDWNSYLRGRDPVLEWIEKQ
jgi:C-terminal processing protease CtpA/Prc